MRRLPTTLAGIVLLEPDVHRDDRGFFVETFRADRYAELGIPADFVQDNHSRSARGVLRGLHFQGGPGQPKLVRVARGRAYDVVVDVRPQSPTFGQYEAFELDDERHLQVWVPGGFAHGFCALSDWTDVVYRVGTYYDPQAEQGLAWDDPEVGIRWPIASPSLSARDAANPRLRDLVAGLGVIE
jgi:dTDP-4-dehydrorhamnose 3,5-epimerase